MGGNGENVLLSKKLCANPIQTISKLYIYIQESSAFLDNFSSIQAFELTELPISEFYSQFVKDLLGKQPILELIHLTMDVFLNR